MRRLFLHSIFLLLLSSVSAQDSFHYMVQLEPVVVNGFPGLHSFAWAQHEGKWLLIGGRLDGVHARQPFNAFPAAMENSNVFVLDIYTKQLWSAPLTTLPAALREQLQSTNINFYQDNDTLYLAGGYGYSPSAGDHITYPFL
ncbi:MAG TPA: hypothetical protein VFZ78_07120, partial [Flavisolibacter sp.]